MKNKVIRIIELIFIILMVSCIISTITNKCQAVVDVTEDQDYWKPDEENVSTDFEGKLGNILGIVSVVGILVSVGTLSVIGIKFMVASVEQKAQYKQALLPWLIGAILLFSLTTLPIIIYNMTNGINKIEEVKVTISQSNVTLKIGEKEEVTLNATVTPNTKRTVSWLTSNSQVATVDSNGKVTAKSVGTAIITAVSGKGKASCTVTVEAVLTTSVTISETSITIDPLTSKTYKLTATITPTNSIEPLYWSSSNSKVATVQNGVVKAVGSGTATITAKSGTKSATCTVQVKGERVYAARYYNPSTGQVSSTRTSSNDLGFMLYIPDLSQITDVDKLPLIVFLHGTGERRKRY